MEDVILEMKHIRKAFGNVLANDDVSLTVTKQSIHALIGENGAGKSTLMNILCGLHTPDEGEILINGETVSIKSTYEAISLGIGMVHQHFMLVPDLTVLENIILGPDTSTKLGLTNYIKSRAEVKKIIDEFQFPIDLNKKIYELSVGEMQRVEIIKALYRRAEILILDEPTAVLTPQETQKLFDVMRDLSIKGKTIILITHKLKEILDISDTVTVMRAGKVTGSIPTCESNEMLLASMMVGRDVILQVEKTEAAPMENILSVTRVEALNDRKITSLKGVSFKARRGEILGIAGVDGNGQDELIEVLTGLRKTIGGKILYGGKDVTNTNSLERRQMGISHIPSDRMKFGINKECSVQDNLILNIYKSNPYCKNSILQHKKIEEYADKLICDFGIAATKETAIGNLSGGNMQKVVIARELDVNPDLLVAANPTRGVDVGAIEFIHKEIIRLRDEGKAVILVSTELDEILSLSDRILVIYEGKIVGEFSDMKNVDELQVGLYMTGTKSMEIAT